jgi:uncharacterized membrane protein
VFAATLALTVAALIGLLTWQLSNPFTRSKIQGQNTLLGVVYVQRQLGVTASREEIAIALTRAIQTRLLEQDFNLTPLIDVNVLEVPNKT